MAAGILRVCTQPSHGRQRGEGGGGTSPGCHSLLGTPLVLPPVQNGSGPPWVTWPKLQESQGRHSCHAVINYLIKRALASAQVPSHLEPSGILRVDGKRPDWTTAPPWKHGRALVWDATYTDTYDPSHVAIAAREAGAVAEQAEKRKTEEYAHLSVSHHFMPFAVETSGVFESEALSLLDDIGRQIRAETGKPRSLQSLLQGTSVAIQQQNAESVLGTAHVIDNIIM